MSMLAERKKKQKWLLTGSMNRKNDWSKDSNKFGQKMLERMGWKEGKGLGRNEDGLTEHIRVAHKSDSKGIGFKESVEWSVQQDNFKSLLQELSKSNDAEDKIESLEEKSQKSRARVHYKKFTRGKDLSKYSKKDLANIFGKKELSFANADDSKDDTSCERSQVEANTSSDSGVVTVEGGSMLDYFKNKKFNFRLRGSVKDDGDSENERASPGFGFGLGFKVSSNDESKEMKKGKQLKNKADTFVSYVNGDKCGEGGGGEIDCQVKKENARKKRKNRVLELEGEQEEEITPCAPSPKKAKLEDLKQKKSKNKIVNDDLMGVANPAFEPLGNYVVVENHNLSTISENNTENDLSVNLRVSEHKENCNKKKRKSKEFNVEEDEIEEEIKHKKKKKKLKGIDNPSLSFDDSQGPSESIEKAKTKSKEKKKKSKGIDNPALKLNESNSFSEENNMESNGLENFEVKRKKKKISKGIDNPALNLNDSNNYKSGEEANDSKISQSTLENPDFDIMLNVTDEPAKPKMGASNKADKHTPKHKTKSVRFSKTNQEFVFSERSPDEISKRDELYDINTKVIRDGLCKLKEENGDDEGAHSFDIKSIDKLDFYNDGTSKKRNCLGIDNEAYDVRAQKVEESVNMISKTIDHYQAEVENGINESKAKKIKVRRSREDFMVGELICSDGENEKHKEGVKLRFKYAKFSKNEPVWVKKNDAGTTFPKKSYKHLIRGDIIVGFRNSNLHEISGYGTPLSGDKMC